MAASEKIEELVERFVRNRDAYLPGAYNEAQVRQEFKCIRILNKLDY